MTHRIKIEKRRVFILSATFLLLGVIFLACKKKESQLGSSAFDPSELLAAGAIDTFTLNTFTIIEDSINTKNPAFNVLGEMYDPVFGKINSSFYTQIRLASTSPSFGASNLIQIDSFVLAMKFSDYTGKIGTQTFEVHRLLEDISSDTAAKFYEYSDLAVDAGNLVMPGRGTFKPDPIGDAMVDTILVAPQMRLALDTNLARDLIEEALNASSTTFASNDNFVSYFKGLKIMTNNPTQSSGQGAIFTLDMRSTASKLTIYYKKIESVDGVPTPVRKEFDFVINENCQSFNHADFYRAGSKVDLANGNLVSGNQEFYAQAFGTRAVLEIPGLNNIPKTAVIHKAILDLPIQFQTSSGYNPGTQVAFSVRVDDNPLKSSVIYRPLVSKFTKSINIDMREYIQNIAIGEMENKRIYISPIRGVTSMDRIIFNGKNTLNKVQPKLYIIYTEF